MKITPTEIEKVEECGQMNGRKVNLIKTKGGFWIATGKKKGSIGDEALAAGSHPAIVKYNLEKQYPDFQPAMMKSEGYIEPIVEKHSHYLEDSLRKSGYDVYSIETGPYVEFQITKHDATIATVDSTLDRDHLTIEELEIPKQFVKALAGAAVEKSNSAKVGLKIRL